MCIRDSELCHGLVGFAWWPGQSQLALATASRMAELLPVALWYFFDEAFLARCPEHAGGGPLFRTFCPACEDCAGPTRDDPRAAKRIEDGLSFIDRELAAIARSRREGRPISSTWATINLCSDGLAYAHAHGRRLQSEAFRQYMVHFGVEAGGYVSTLDALQARLEDVLHGLLGLRQPAALAPDAERGQARWMLQEVGWRLLATWHECEGEAQQQIWDLAMRLAQGLTDGEPPGLEVARARLAEAVSTCLLYTSPSPRDATLSRMPSSA